ncbi:LysR family transcriptional regulator [Vibrio sp. S4M6]|uniref:LysR family transcriptional regulator n=1 Tax=Vibrio sinus TaxID=2946865 RepID=UPI00202A6B86|nr:LysR family transcriptional regulator [Vibrio sinus]MCL9781741.1 LysR family transcriptional regulator [Vibrio sinus]
MKINDLAIFVEVAKAQSLRQAARQLGIHPGTLSKTIKRIEEHYQHEMFSRIGGNWALTSAGETLFQRAIELIEVNEKIERELGKPRRPHLRVSGPNAVLSYFLPGLMHQFIAAQPQATIETKTAHDLSMLLKHDVDLALICQLNDQPPSERQIVAKKLRKVTFVTAANLNHPLVSRSGQVTPIEQVLQHPFIVPSQPFYGKMEEQRSPDGWHDEHFSRLISARVDNTAALIALINARPLLAYLPDYIAHEHKLHVIKTSGCPYTCEQSLWLCQHKQRQHYWMQIFD